MDYLGTVTGINELLGVDISLKHRQFSYKVVDVGIKTIQLLLNETVSDVDTTKFWKDWVQFYASSPGYLIQNLPFNESLIQHAQSLNRRNRTDVKCSNANWSI